jgi:hypothetical protein
MYRRTILPCQLDFGLRRGISFDGINRDRTAFTVEDGSANICVFMEHRYIESLGSNKNIHACFDIGPASHRKNETEADLTGSPEERLWEEISGAYDRP